MSFLQTVFQWSRRFGVELRPELSGGGWAPADAGRHAAGTGHAAKRAILCSRVAERC